MKAVAIGLTIGALAFCAFVAPALLRRTSAQKADAIQQHNLVSARGEAYGSFDMAEVSLTVLLGGAPREGLSVSAGMRYWEVPGNGEMEMRLAPGNYTLTAGYQNRTLRYTCRVDTGQPNTFVLDVDKAPWAPEYLLLDVAPEGWQEIPLGISGADTVSVSNNEQDSITVAKLDGEYHLLFDADALAGGTYCLRLALENEFGTAVSFIFVRLPRTGPVTDIYTAEDLYAIRNNLSGSYRLMNNIDMSGMDWRPIGNSDYPFTGSFDGGGHEITGLFAPDEYLEGLNFALFDHVKYGELRDVIIREPAITPLMPDRSLGEYYGCSVLAGNVTESIVENCASIGGRVSSSDGAAGGLLGGAVLSLVRGCFNSTEVYCNMTNNYLPNTGGISGGGTYALYTQCANEGGVKGNHLTGGIGGHSSSSYFTRCVNSGYIWGSTIVGAVPVGGIVQSNDNGHAGYSYFVRSQSPSGAFCGGDGFTASIIPIEWSALRSPEQLPLLGTFEGQSPDWAYASLDAQGPVPYGIFKAQAARPEILQSGGRVVVPPQEGVLYFYSVDGTSPYLTGQEPVPELNLALGQNETLQVFAAKQGCRDSEIVIVAGGA